MLHGPIVAGVDGALRSCAADVRRSYVLIGLPFASAWVGHLRHCYSLARSLATPTIYLATETNHSQLLSYTCTCLLYLCKHASTQSVCIMYWLDALVWKRVNDVLMVLIMMVMIMIIIMRNKRIRKRTTITSRRVAVHSGTHCNIGSKRG